MPTISASARGILKTFVETYTETAQHVALDARLNSPMTIVRFRSKFPICRNSSASCSIGWHKIDEEVRAAYDAFDYKKVIAVLSHFMTSDLSAFYFDIRKDALYCDPPSSAKRRAALAGHRIDLPRRDALARADPRLHLRRSRLWSECRSGDGNGGFGAPPREFDSSCAFPLLAEIL